MTHRQGKVLSLQLERREILETLILIQALVLIMENRYDQVHHRIVFRHRGELGSLELIHLALAHMMIEIMIMDLVLELHIQFLRMRKENQFHQILALDNINCHVHLLMYQDMKSLAHQRISDGSEVITYYYYVF